MKKRILLFIAAAGISAAAQAQNTRLGLKLGPSLTSFTGDDVRDAAYKFGFHAGGVAELNVNDRIAIQPEVLFSMKGAKAEDADFSYNSSYVDFPVLLKIKANGLFFEAGPQAGILLTSRFKADDLSVDVKDEFKGFDLGYAAGLGFQAASGLMVGLRYNGGITRIGKDTKIGSVTIEAGEVRNSAFQLYAGFLFGSK
ncbi:porin family protein [Hymenobacter aquaticus]|nr:porin family protein [Hymenobacter aquaticus]